MNDFEQGLANIMGSFMEVNLDCVEKQNQEIEQLQNNWNELKKWLEEQKEFIKDIPTFTLEITHNHFGMVGAYKNTLSKMQELEEVKDE